jgi:hypothetical protein
MRFKHKAAVAAAIVALTGSAQAALFDRGGGMIYDATRNITWLADMNYAQTSGHTGTGVNANGRMTWAAATAWADNLVYGGFSDWRLPTVDPADASCTGVFGVGLGYDCTGGELGGLFVTDLGIKAYESVLNQVGDTPDQIANLALFSNVNPDYFWSGTEYAPNPIGAFSFSAGEGNLSVLVKGFASYAVAVRPGDVAAAIPEPQTYALMLMGVGAVLLARRKRTR